MKSDHYMIVAIVWVGLSIATEKESHSLILLAGGIFYAVLSIIVWHGCEKRGAMKQ